MFLHGRFVALLFGLLANTLESTVLEALKMPVCVRFVAVVLTHSVRVPQRL